MLPHLCSNCRKAFAGSASQFPNADRASPKFYIHKNFQSFAHSHRIRCRVCYDLWTHLLAVTDISVEKLSASGLMVVLDVTSLLKNDEKPRCIFWVYDFYVRESASSSVLKSTYMMNRDLSPKRFALSNEWYQLIYSRVYVLTESNGSADSRSVEEVGSSSKLKPSREVTNNWIRSCVEGHQECKPWRNMGTDPARPARILDVGERGNAQIRLRILKEEDEFDEDYLTLSYCKGNFTSMELTKKTLDQLVAGLEPQRLPRTFRNAVAVTRQLGVRYLWIDILCILQDSEDDRYIEGGKSGDIFGNGLLNIFAAGANDCDGGLFFDREAFIVQPLQVKITWPMYQSYTAISHPDLSVPPTLYDCNGMGDWRDAVDCATISKRAWPLGERFVSRRTLYCCKEQLYWECKKGRGNESFPNGLGTTPESSLISTSIDVLDRVATTGAWKISNFGKWEFSPSLNYPLIQEAYREWTKLIEIYTSRVLTRNDDKLLAFSGVAKRFEALLHDQYICGLLKRNFQIGLLWFTKNSSAVQLNADKLIVSWRPPTWSWAAINGKAEWDRASLAQPLSEGEVLEGDLLEYISHEERSTLPESTQSSGTTRLTVRAFWISLFTYMRRLPADTVIETSGLNTRTLWMRTSPTMVHYGVAQFDDPETMQQIMTGIGDRDITSLIGIPVRWSIETVGLPASSQERNLRIRGLLVRPAYSDIKGYESFFRIGRFTLEANFSAGNDNAQNELFDYIQGFHDSDLLKEYTLC